MKWSPELFSGEKYVAPGGKRAKSKSKGNLKVWWAESCWQLLQQLIQESRCHLFNLHHLIHSYFNLRLSKDSRTDKGHSSCCLKEQCEEPGDSERHSSNCFVFTGAASALELSLVPTQRFPAPIKLKPVLDFQSFRKTGQPLKTSLGILPVPSGQKGHIYNSKLNRARSYCLV